MAFTWIDWTIIIGFLAAMIGAALYTSRYTRSVADFLAANRTADRYLICVADGMAGMAAISLVMFFEMYYQAGFPFAWWDLARAMIIPTILSLSGWIICRFRETRALTLAQFFEMRYSRRFRIFSGFLAWFSGILNFGIFPAVGAGFFMHFFGLPDSRLIHFAIMTFLLGIALFFTFVGGHIAVMVTDFLQGIFCNIVVVIITYFLLRMFDWKHIITTLSANSISNASMIHPFHVAGARDFNTLYYLMIAFITAYIFMSWQGSQGYNAAARNAHEARMGRSLSVFRMFAMNAFVLVVPICAFTFMNCPDFADRSAQANSVLSGIKDPVITKQAVVVIALRYMLPIGLLGAICATMGAAFIANCEAYMHSWGSIFIQDIVLPLRKKPISQQQHLKWLRGSITGVAVFILLFSVFFKQTEYIAMFFSITGAIFTGGAGSAIIGGLYWKRGTTGGAWAAMIVGAVLSIGGIVLQQIHAVSPFSNKILEYVASRNGVTLSFWAAIGAICSYVIVSLIGKKTNVNLDELLHRGKYSIAEDRIQGSNTKINSLQSLIGIDKDFTFRDKVVYIMMVLWISIVIIGFVGVSIYNFMSDVPLSWWAQFWKFYVWLSLVCGAFTTVWFAIGGWIDMKNLFKLLSKSQINEQDDGRVNNNETFENKKTTLEVIDQTK